MLATGTFVVVADGTSALIYRNSGHDTISLVLQETVTPHNLLNHGPAGSIRVEQSPHDRDVFKTTGSQAERPGTGAPCARRRGYYRRPFVAWPHAPAVSC